MSGPIEESDRVGTDLGLSAIEIKEGRTTRIGEMGILRVLPTKRRRTIGPWCFVDLMSPDDVDMPPPLEIGPHPHIGLATVTWLFGGLVLHSDSLGTAQPIRPGELNLMTAGHGIAHAEEGLETESAERTGGVMGVQMWLAQPEGTRDGQSAFQHVTELPEVEIPGGRLQLLIGEFAGERSTAVFEHPAVGMDLRMETTAELATRVDFEHGVIPVDRPIKIEDAIVEPGSLAIVPPGYELLRLESRSGPARLMLLGGLPLGEQVKMWWNFVARTEDEISLAWRDWQSHNSDRFPSVPSRLTRIEAPRPPWLHRDD